MKSSRRQLLVSAGALVALSPISTQADWLRRLLTPKTPSHLVRTIWVFETEYVGELQSRLAIAAAFPGAEVRVFKESPQTVAQGRIHAAPDLIVHSLKQPEEISALFKIKKASKGRTFLLQIDDPEQNYDNFDLLVNPRHLDPFHEGGRNIIRPMGLPSRITPTKLEEARQEWADRLGPYPGPRIALLVGGQTNEKSFPPTIASQLGQKVGSLALSTGSSLFISNSRRTPDRSFNALMDEVQGGPLYIYDAKSENPDANPYVAMLAYADFIIVTGDSGSMLSDACSTGKPVYIFAPDSTVEKRHKRLIIDLVQSGRARMLLPQTQLEKFAYPPLKVAEEIRNAVEMRRGCEGILT